MGMKNKVNYFFKNKDYKKILTTLNKYLSNPNNKIDTDILIKYIYSLLNLGYFDMTHRHIEFLNKEKVLTDYEIASLYIQANNKEKALSIIEDNYFSDIEYFDLARRFYQTGNYNEAYRYFSLLKAFSKDYDIISSSSGFIKKIERHNKEGEFIKISYPYAPLYTKQKSIVKVKDINNDSESLYLVWKKVGSKLYAFKLDANEDKSYISSKRYKNLDSNMTTIPRLVELDNSDVEQVIEKLSNKDFYRIINDTYKKIMTLGSQKDKSLSSGFISEYRKRLNIEKHDIITVYEKETNTEKKYFITGIKDKKGYYNAVEVINNNGIYMLNAQHKQRIKFNSRILSNKKISPAEQNRISIECENLLVLKQEPIKKKKVKVVRVGDKYDC